MNVYCIHIYICMYYVDIMYTCTLQTIRTCMHAMNPCVYMYMHTYIYIHIHAYVCVLREREREKHTQGEMDTSPSSTYMCKLLQQGACNMVRVLISMHGHLLRGLPAALVTIRKPSSVAALA